MSGVFHQQPGALAGRSSRRSRLVPVAVLALLPVLPMTLPAQLAVGRVELVMDAANRTSRDAAVNVRNESDRAVQAIVRLEDWDRTSDGTNRWYGYGALAGKGSCAPALSVFPQALRLEPGAEQALVVTHDSTRVPAGECWAAAIIETVHPVDRGGQRVSYVVRTAVKIYVQPAGLEPGGEIEALRFGADSTTGARGREALEMVFSNTGTRHVVANGSLEIRTAENALVRRIPLPPVYALPGARHIVRVPMPPLPPGRYVFLATMDYGGADIAAALLEHRAR